MKKQLYISLTCISLLLTSCHPGLEVQVVNNAGHKIRVVSINPKYQETQYSVDVGQVVAIEVPYKMRVEWDGGIWKYDPKPVPSTFEKKVGARRYRHIFQVESDGSVFALLPDSTGVITNLPPQPPGYPIRPGQ